jgi:murein DD-endopeptidase MepM/ murein hydrolase activator NlpD
MNNKTVPFFNVSFQLTIKSASAVSAVLAMALVLGACSSGGAQTLVHPAPSPTGTPTTLPTPTATPLPAHIETSDFTLPSHPPEPVYGAPCGLVDYFDFPLDPPDARNVRGGQDFAVYRERYNGIHTGEDWWYGSVSSLGMPVYSIGYGQVSYAHTYGWGRDLGTLVIRHVLQSGRTIYSFYGHLDPDSLDLRLGDCVTRGQLVGLIGDPRSAPHLHFEIRSVFANQPGPGYWSTDPERAGWFPPSRTIEESRLAISPGLVWWHDFDADRVRYLGVFEGAIALVEVGDELLAFDLEEGVELARAEISGLHSYTSWDPDRRWLVAADMSGRLNTWHVRLEYNRDEYQLTLTPVWEVETHHMGSLALVPLPNNWLAVVQGSNLTAIDPGGEIAWEAELGGRIQGWLQLEDQSLLSTYGQEPGVWSVTMEGLESWDIESVGPLFDSSIGPFLYTRQGLYHLDTDSRQAQQWIAWDMADLDSAQLVELTDGRFVVNHSNLQESLLIWFDEGGQLLQQVRYDEAIEHDQVSLVASEDAVYLISQLRETSSAIASVFRLTPPGDLELIFRTVTRQSFLSESWSAAIEQGVLLALQGVRYMLISP